MNKRNPDDFVDTDGISYRDLRQHYEDSNRASALALLGDAACAILIVALIASPLWLPAVATAIWGE